MLRIALVLALVFAAAPATLRAQTFDLLIRDGRIVDGTGNPWFRGDIGVRDGRIVAVGMLNDAEAARTIDANNRVVAPGFIDLMGVNSWPLVADPASAESRLRQGITTMMVGEGGSHAPQNERTLGRGPELDGERVTWRTFDEYFAILEAEGLRLNVIHNVGAAQVRRVVLGDGKVKPTTTQLDAMRQLVAEAMEDGAAGLSTALIYPPGTYASTEELVALAEVAARYGGTYFTHMRNESGQLLEAIEESLEIGARAEIPVHVFHLKATGRENWPLMAEALRRIERARAEGMDVTTDVYPYIRNGIGLRSFIHPRHYVGGAAAFVATLDDPEVRRTLRQEIETTSDWENWYRHVGSDWDRVLITGASGAEDSEIAGLSLAEAADRRGQDPWDTFFDLVQTGGVDVAPESMNEEQKVLALQKPFVGVDVDTQPINPATATSAHPRAFGSFPRILAKYVRTDGVLTLETAVKKLTSFPANRLRLHDRGRIAPGMAADLVVFDPATIQDNATFQDPLQFATGIDYMVVNGELVIDGGELTGAKPGGALRHGTTAEAY